MKRNTIPRPDWVYKCPETADILYFIDQGERDETSNQKSLCALLFVETQIAEYIESAPSRALVSGEDENDQSLKSSFQSTSKGKITSTRKVASWEDANGTYYALYACDKAEIDRAQKELKEVRK